MEFIKNKLRIVSLIFAVMAVPLFSGCGTEAPSSYTVNLEIWGTFDDSMTYAEIINQYKKINPHIGEIKYRKFSQDTYRQELIDALASGKGPDIFLINNTWFPSFENKLYPAPTPLMSGQDVENNFPDVVSADFADAGKVYAVPLSIDSMQLYYNRDMFNAAGIVLPPKNWQEFQNDVRKLTAVDVAGNIARSGAAIGTARNINRATDLMGMLMIQNGVEMPSQKNKLAKFNEGVVVPGGGVVQAGEEALRYYTQFAASTSVRNPFYTWNVKQNNSVEAFSQGTVAMMFNYYWQNANIRSANPKLNFAVAPVPQIYSDKPASIANYWGYAVALNKIPTVDPVAGPVAQTPITNDTRAHEAWQFLRFLTLKNSGMITLYNAITKNSKDFPVNFDPALDYLKKTNQPAARRDIIESQKNDPVLGTFATGNLIAKSWYQSDPDATVGIFSDMIDSVNSGSASFQEALLMARNRMNSSGGSVGR